MLSQPYDPFEGGNHFVISLRALVGLDRQHQCRDAVRSVPQGRLHDLLGFVHLVVSEMRFDE